MKEAWFLKKGIVEDYTKKHGRCSLWKLELFSSEIGIVISHYLLSA